MELVDGEDLSRRIAGRPMPMGEALAIAKQIADALEAAHEQGIIHRDLTPANIKVRLDGTVKVLDFGLAKALEPAGASKCERRGLANDHLARDDRDGRDSRHRGLHGAEQARGKVVDKRADIWAFGVVLFEMLTGRQAFPGDDISHVLARVIERDPDWTALPPTTPPLVVRLLRRCLDKDVRRRLRDIADATADLEDATQFERGGATPARARPSGSMSSATRSLAIGERTRDQQLHPTSMRIGVSP